MLRARHDLGARRAGVVRQQHVGIEQHARRAVSAPKRPVIDEGLLERMKYAPGREILDGYHFRAGYLMEQ